MINWPEFGFEDLFEIKKKGNNLCSASFYRLVIPSMPLKSWATLRYLSLILISAPKSCGCQIRKG